MTAVLDVTADVYPDPDPPAPPASWGARAGALIIDVFFGGALITTLALLAWMAPLLGWMWWLCVVLAALIGVALMVNRWVLPARTGWTVGRAVTGIRVMRRDGAAVGTGRLVVRDIAHLLDTVSLLGWLWPLWDRRHRTFADLLLRTEVHRVGEPTRGIRRPVAIGLLAIAAVCVAVTATGYLVGYRHDRALEAARTQISEQGPGIVEKLLSYTPDTLDDDFARAQSLAADGYRPQLIEQQDAVRKGPVEANEYWTVNSAVLENPALTPTSATMLLAMQGQRGGADPQTQKFITATVRVDFVKTSDVNSGDQWQVQHLSVLTRPNAGPKATGGGG